MAKLKAAEIRKLIKAHNIEETVKIPTGLKKDELVKFVESKGFKINHDEKSISKGGKKITLEQAEKLTAPKQKTALQKQKAAEKKEEKDVVQKKKERELKKEAVKKATKDMVPKTKPPKKIGAKPIPKKKPLKKEDEVRPVSKVGRPRVDPSKIKVLKKKKEAKEEKPEKEKKIRKGTKKDEKSPPPLRFSGSKSKIDKIKSKVKKGKISVEEGLKEWKIDIEAYERRRKVSEKSLINKGYKSGGVDELKALEKEGIEIIKN